MAKVDNPRGQSNFYTGKMHERDAFGKFRPTAGFASAYSAMAQDNGYVSYNDALELVRKHGRQDPLNPDKPFGNELRQAVIEAMDLESGEDMDRVKFYSAVETPADRFHGIDGWIEYEAPNGSTVIVTVDVTKNPEKDAWKADVIIPEVTDPSDGEDAFIKQAEQYGRQIAERIQQRVQLSAM